MKVIKVIGKDKRTGEGVAQFFDWHEESGRLARSNYWSLQSGGSHCETLEDAKAVAVEMARCKGIINATALCL